MFFRKNKTETKVSDLELAEKIKRLISLLDNEGDKDIDIPMSRIENMIGYCLMILRQEITEVPGIASLDMLADLDMVISARGRDGLVLSMIPSWVIVDMAVCVLDIEMDSLEHAPGSTHDEMLALSSARERMREMNAEEMKLQYEITRSSGDATTELAEKIINMYGDSPTEENAKTLHEYAQKITRLEKIKQKNEEEGVFPYREKAPF